MRSIALLFENKMSIQLLRFPHLVQRLILKQMNYEDLFFLSLISKKSINLIQSARWREVKGIEYGMGSKMITVLIDNGQTCKRPLLQINLTKSEENLQKINISGRELDFSTKKYQPLTIYTLFPNEDVSNEDIAEIIYGHLNLIFGSHVKYTLAQGSPIEPLVLPKRIPFCETTVLTGRKPHAAQFEEYFEAVPVQEHINFRAVMEGHFRRNSKFYDARKLDFVCAGSNGAHILKNFRGKFAHFKCLECYDTDVIRFLRRWKSKEAFENLESFHVEIIYFLNFRMSPETIQNAVEIKKLPDSFGPQNFKCRKIGIHYGLNLFITIETSTYIVREDGIVALIFVAFDEFVLRVTKYTEEEVLRMKCIPLD